MATTLGGVEIPAAYVEETSRQIIGGGIVRAVDGTAHRTPVRIIRTWQVETRPISYEQYKAIEDMVLSTGGGAVAFHSSEWDVGFTYVYIVAFDDSRTLIPDTSAPGKNLHTVRLTLEEA